MTFTTDGVFLFPIYRVLGMYGINPVDFFKHYGVTYKAIEQNLKIDHFIYNQIVNDLKNLTSDNLIALKLSEIWMSYFENSTGVLNRILSKQYNLLQLSLATKYFFKSINHAAEHQLKIEENKAYYVINYLFPDHIDCQQVTLFGLHLIHSNFLRLIGEHWKPTCIHLKKDVNHALCQELSKAFGCDIKPNSEFDAIEFPRTLIYSPLKRDLVTTTSKAQKIQLTNNLANIPDLQNELINIISQLIKEQQGFGIEDISNILGISIRVLQKQLQVKNTRYTELLAKARMQLALALLTAKPDMKIHEISAFLGYNRSSIFSVAFKREHKLSPKQYRDLYKK